MGDCITFGTAMQGYLMSADSIAEQTELLVAILCPQAQDQAECDAAIRKYWEGIALAMYPVFLDANDVCAQLGVCKKNAKLALTKAGCGPDETECPAGCCPEANWYCCADNQHCAATAANCPFKNPLPPRLLSPLVRTAPELSTVSEMLLSLRPRLLKSWTSSREMPTVDLWEMLIVLLSSMP